jgi:APA family basic amino acid/polyamine antiporter
LNDTSALLPRRLSAWSLGAITVGIVIGSGIFRSPSEIAGLVGTPLGVLVVWLLGGVVTICLALSVAELAAMFPRAGGLYAYLEEAFGRRAAFIFGWTFLLINPANWAAIALIFVDYLGIFVPVGPSQSRLIASAAILVVSMVNIVSLNLSSRFNWLFTFIKGLALILLSAGILLWSSPPHQPSGFVHHSASIAGWGTALIAVLWPFEGVVAAAAMAGEVRDPKRSLPIGLIGGTLFVTLTYLLVNAALLKSLAVDGMAASAFVAADAARASMGALGGTLVAACAVVATFGALIAGATCDPRVLFAMAKDRLFFSRVGAVHGRFRTPHIAILLSCIVAIAYVWIRTFEELAAQFVLGMWVFYGLCVIGLIRLRRTQPDVVRPYRVPWFPVLPLVFIVACGALLVNAFIELPTTSLVNVVVIALGLPVYELWMLIAGDRRKAARDGI